MLAADAGWTSGGVGFRHRSGQLHGGGSDGRNWDGIQYYDPASGKGTVYLFKPAAAPASQNFRLKGLDRAASYRTSFEDGTRTTAVKTGVELMDQGLTVTLPGAEMSELIFFEVVR